MLLVAYSRSIFSAELIFENGQKVSATFVGHSIPLIFTARPKAQRCQVTPYVVNVAAVAAAAGGSDS